MAWPSPYSTKNPTPKQSLKLCAAFSSTWQGFSKTGQRPRATTELLEPPPLPAQSSGPRARRPKLASLVEPKRIGCVLWGVSPHSASFQGGKGMELSCAWTEGSGVLALIRAPFAGMTTKVQSSRKGQRECWVRLAV